MTRLSSRRALFVKRVFPVLWFGILVAVVVGILLASPAGKAVRVAAVPPVLVGVLGYALFRKLLFDLADEVYDCGDSLLVREGGLEDVIPLSNVMNVSATTLINPPRVADLIVRVDRARAGRAS